MIFMKKSNKITLAKNGLSLLVVFGFLILFLSEIGASINRQKLLNEELSKIRFTKTLINTTNVCMKDNIDNEVIYNCLEKLNEIKKLDEERRYIEIYAVVRRYVILQKIDTKIEYKNEDNRLKIHKFNVLVGQQDGDLTTRTTFETPEELKKYLQKKYKKLLTLL